MFKAIKDEKIIAINNTGIFNLLVCDSIEEDKEHTLDDYEQYKGEYLLKSEVPPPTWEEVDKARIEYRKTHIDNRTIARMRKTANGSWTEQDEEEYLALDEEVTEWIEENLPYPVGE